MSAARITLRLSLQDLTDLRLAFSPLWEVVASMRVLKGAPANAPDPQWVEAARARLRSAGVGLPMLDRLVDASSPILPGFLAPTPLSPLCSIEDELVALRETDPAFVRRELERVSATGGTSAAALPRDVDRLLSALAEECRAYFEVVLAPLWPRLRATLEDDVLYRSRQLAAGGPRLLFEGLHPNVALVGHELHVHRTRLDLRRELGGRGLVLCPSAFVSPRLFVKRDEPRPAVLRYPARAAAEVWLGSPRAGGGLAGVLGATRARLLLELERPASTSELARRLGLAVGGVSTHLHRLAAAGLVTGSRVGASVLYRRTAVGDALAGESAPGSAGGAALPAAE